MSCSRLLSFAHDGAIFGPSHTLAGYAIAYSAKPAVPPLSTFRFQASITRYLSAIALPQGPMLCGEGSSSPDGTAAATHSHRRLTGRHPRPADRSTGRGLGTAGLTHITLPNRTAAAIARLVLRNRAGQGAGVRGDS
jgi:hypothetical protein